MVGDAIGIKEEGGILNQTAQEVEIKCLPMDIPNSIDVNIESLSIYGNHISDCLDVDFSELEMENVSVNDCGNDGIDFSFSKIVNQDLKQMLISPNLINYRSITDNIELDFKNKDLTNNQQDIIKKAFNEKNIFLVQGPPGTGKTTIIKEMIYQTIKQDKYSKILKRERNQKKKEHIKKVKGQWYLNNKESIQRQQKMYRASI